MRVEVVTAWPHRCESVVVELEAGATVEDAVRVSGLASQQMVAGVAVHGVKARLTDPVSDGDRVELLRALEVDPKTARHLRAQAQRERRRVR